MYNILVVADDPAPLSRLIDLLRKDFLSVFNLAFDELDSHLDTLKTYDFVLLVLESDEINNIRRILQIKLNCVCPLYVFSKERTEEDVIKLLEYGAEGHIQIPFRAEIVMPRIKSVLRFLHQVKRGSPVQMRFGRLILHIDNREVTVDGVQIPLTNVEFKILQILAEHRDSVVSKEKIISRVWDQDQSATDNALGIHITRLRKKLVCLPHPDLIETVWGLGYRLNLAACEENKNHNV